MARSRTGRAADPPRLTSSAAQTANLSKTPSSPRPSPPVRGHQPRHLSPQPSACATVAKTSPECGGEKGRGKSPAQPNCGQKKKKFLLRPIPSAGVENPKQAGLQLQPRPRRGRRGAGGGRRPRPAASGALAPGSSPHPPRHKASPPTIPAGSSWVSRARALRVSPPPFPARPLLCSRALSPRLFQNAAAG